MALRRLLAALGFVTLSSASLLPAAERTLPRPATEAAWAARGRFQVEFSREARQSASPPSVEWLPVPSPTTLALRRIVGSDAATLAERLQAVRELGPELTRDQIAALQVFLKAPPPGDDGLEQFRALKNDVLNVLRQQATPAAGVTELLAAVFRDPAQDAVLRGYALQHAVIWYEQGASDVPDGRERIRALLSEAAREKSNLAGTALLGLHRLSEHDGALDAGEINRAAMRLVQAEETDPASRLTAMQVCAERGLTEALPVIESLAAASACVPLRLSAIAAVGRLGGQAQVRLLGRVEKEQDAVMREGARLALRKLRQRHGRL
jgi:hypothetical protein